jgi:transcriptional regulator of arginine metabolism
VKSQRQRKILEIVATRTIRTQSELVQALAAEGISATQATVSRDIRELQLTKVPSGDGRYQYVAERMRLNGPDRDLIQECLLDVDHSENVVVVRTMKGTGGMVAQALEHLDWPEVIGCVSDERRW